LLVPFGDHCLMQEVQEVVVVVVDSPWLLGVVVVEVAGATKHLLCLLVILNLTGCLQPVCPCLLYVVVLSWWWEKLLCFVNPSWDLLCLHLVCLMVLHLGPDLCRLVQSFHQWWGDQLLLVVLSLVP
jgi:hypothetical protein